MTLKGQGQKVTYMFKVNFQKCSEWPENSSENLWICKYRVLAYRDTHIYKWTVRNVQIKYSTIYI